VAERALRLGTVERIVTAAARRIGLDEAEVARLAGHSLRAGLATAAAVGGASEHSSMRQTGHTTREMVDRSVRDGALVRDNAAATAGR